MKKENDWVEREILYRCINWVCKIQNYFTKELSWHQFYTTIGITKKYILNFTQYLVSILYTVPLEMF